MTSIRLMMLALLMLPLATGCVSNSVFATDTGCSALVPSDWRAGVDNAALPLLLKREDFPDDAAYLDALARGWMKFGTAQTGQLAKANGRTADAVGIVERCEARDRKAIERAKPKLFGIL